MPKDGVPHSRAEREANEIAHRAATGAIAKPARRHHILDVLKAGDEAHDTGLRQAYMAVAADGVSLEEVQALVVRQYLLYQDAATDAAEGGAADTALQYDRLSVRLLEIIRKIAAEGDGSTSVERIIFEIRRAPEADAREIELPAGDAIPVE